MQMSLSTLLEEAMKRVTKDMDPTVGTLMVLNVVYSIFIKATDPTVGTMMVLMMMNVVCGIFVIYLNFCSHVVKSLGT